CPLTESTSRGTYRRPMRSASPFLDRDHLASAVGAAVRAGTVAQGPLTALGTSDHVGRAERVVGSPLVPLGCGRAALRNCHAYSSSVTGYALPTAQQRLQCRQARVPQAGGTIAGDDVQVRSTPRAQPAAILRAQRTGRQRENCLLVNQRREIDLVALVDREPDVLLAECSRARRRRRLRGQDDRQRRFERKAILREAAGAAALDRAPHGPLEEDVEAGSVIGH